MVPRPRHRHHPHRSGRTAGASISPRAVLRGALFVMPARQTLQIVVELGKDELSIVIHWGLLPLTINLSGQSISRWSINGAYRGLGCDRHRMPPKHPSASLTQTMGGETNGEG